MKPASQSTIPSASDSPPLPAAFAVALLVMIAMSWAQLAAMWTTGAFIDTDDAARMAQVRDFVAGQGWHDLTQRRLAPPDGHQSHWTRVVDVPLAAMLLFWSSFFETENAEFLARMSFTLGLFALLLWAAARLGRTLMGEAGVIPALAVVVLSGMGNVQFQWGRIDHHAPQLLVILFTLEAALRSLEPGQARRSVLVGLWAALSLSINVETLGLLAVACAAGPAAWIWRGGDRTALFGLAAGLAAGLPVAGLAFIPQGEAARLACDAISPALVSAGLIAAAALVVLGICAPRLHGAGARLTVSAAVALAAGGLAGWLNPHCLGNPYGDIDPLVREMWQDLVNESTPLAKLLRDDFQGAFPMIAPAVFAALGTVYAVAQTSGEARLKWLTMAAATTVALAVVTIEVRAMSQLYIASLWGGAFVFLRLRTTRSLTWAMPALFAITPATWSLVTPAPAGGAQAERPWSACYTPATFRDMAALPPGVVAGPVFLGSHILAHTPHSALAAPYHRMTKSIRATLDIFVAEPERARQLAAAAGVRYVALCFDPDSLGVIIKRGPNGLAAALTSTGGAIDWLRPVVETGPLRVYEVRAPAGPQP
jgi:hypothetical protein